MELLPSMEACIRSKDRIFDLDQYIFFKSSLNGRRLKIIKLTGIRYAMGYTKVRCHYDAVLRFFSGQQHIFFLKNKGDKAIPVLKHTKRIMIFQNMTPNQSKILN